MTAFDNTAICDILVMHTTRQRALNCRDGESEADGDGFPDRYIFEALNDGRLNMKQLDEAVTRTLALKARSAVSEGLTKWMPWDIL